MCVLSISSKELSVDKKAEKLLSDVILYKDKIWALVYSILKDYHLSEDVVQEVCFFIANTPDKYDESRPFLPWAMGVARFKAYEAVRKAEKQAASLEDDVLEKLQNDLVELERDEDARILALQNCLSEVSTENKQIMMMKYVEKLSAQNIADKINRTPVATFSLLQRLRASIASCINKKVKVEGLEHD